MAAEARLTERQLRLLKLTLNEIIVTTTIIIINNNKLYEDLLGQLLSLTSTPKPQNSSFCISL